jgi:hypothetical protein
VKAHPFPFQIGVQTLEFLQGTIFYVSFADIATGEFVRTPGALEHVKALFLQRLYTEQTYDEAWDYLKKYQHIFKKATFSNVLISFCSHWDWYIRQLAAFVGFARNHVESPNLSKAETRDLARIGRISFVRQVESLEKAIGVPFEVSKEIQVQLKEMALVRNLGLHNRWEVDEKYLELTGTKGLALGDLRLVEVDELYDWHGGLMRLITETSKRIAVRYVNAPSYP